MRVLIFLILCIWLFLCILWVCLAWLKNVKGSELVINVKDESEIAENGIVENDIEAKAEERPSQDDIINEKTAELLDEMTLEEKIFQMFIVTPEQLTGLSTVTAAREQTKKSIETHPIGGIIYFDQNLINPNQVEEMLENVQAYSFEIEGLPLFLCIDEEGGRVSRIANKDSFGEKNVGTMENIETKEQAYEAGSTIGEYLSEYGFNVNFAPDADVITNSANLVIGDRSFGNDSEIVSEFAVAYSDGLHSQKVMSTFKHFPGHGATEADTHNGYAYMNKTYDELVENELKPFIIAEKNDVDFIMVAHISAPNIVGDNTPCTLSNKMIDEILRGDVGYKGLIITDALNMGAIEQNYSSNEACVQAVKAGNDILLMPKNLDEACMAIKNAVEAGEIDEKRIDESVSRIIKTKISKINVEGYHMDKETESE